MRKYCNTIEEGISTLKSKDLQAQFLKIKNWYIKQHSDVQMLLKGEMLSTLVDTIKKQTSSINNLSDDFNTKLSLFSVAEWTMKHILSCFSIGPDSASKTSLVGTKSRSTWFDVNYDFPSLVEILQSELNKNDIGSELNLYTLLEDRDVRNGFTHAGKTDVCLSAIRCYNTIRNMLVFLEPESISELPLFRYPESPQYSINDFFSHTNNLDFKNNTTILVTGALHDLQQNHKQLVANLPWDVVLDFDGYSEFGGLFSLANRNNINYRLFTNAVANSLVFTKGFTHWLKCGEYVNYNLAQNKNGDNHRVVDMLTPKQPFFENIKFFSTQPYLQQLLDKVITMCATVHNPITIVFILGDEQVAQTLLSLCEQNLNNVSYSFTGVFYVSNETVANIENYAFNSYKQVGEDYDDKFKFIQVDLDTFFADLYQYKDQFKLQIAKPVGKELPSINGFTQVSANVYTNLFSYFEVLYNEVGQASLDEVNSDITNFYKGDKASWATFASGRVVDSILPSEYNKHIDKIKTNLGRIQQFGKDRIFSIEHIPGIGGSTLLRKIAWDLHLLYPVMLIKKYDKFKVKTLITEIYDLQKKGVVIIADSDFSEIEELIRDIHVIDRPCVLIYSTRQSKNSNQNENKIALNKITSQAEQKLRLAFKQFSSLTKEDLIVKDSEYNLYITQDVSMHTPFIIGLYYMEKDFKGVQSYIEQISAEINEHTQIKAFAFICLADIYGHTVIPATLINNYLRIKPYSNILDGLPHSKGVFIRSSNNGMTYYKPKHFLLSEKMLEFCCRKLYNNVLKNSLSVLANDFVDFMVNVCSNNFLDNYRDLLEKVFTSRSTSIYGLTSFSKIIEDIITPEARIDVLKNISEKFLKIAQQKNVDECPALYMMTAHFFGHLGRLYSKDGIGIVNNSKSLEYASIAVELMEKCDKSDPVVLHMYAEAKLNDLQSEFYNVLNQSSENEVIDFVQFEDRISEIEEIFNKVASSGSPDYAYTSTMGMYIEYLAFVYKVKKISNSNEFFKLSPQQRIFQTKINELIEILNDIEDMGEKTQSIFIKQVNMYRSDIMMGDFGGAINYYDNQLSELTKKSPNAVTEIINARSGLVYSIIGKYKCNAKDIPNVFSVMSNSDIERVLSLLENIMTQGFDITKYQERQRRMMACKTWLRASKFSKRTIEQGLIVAQQWANCESKHKEKDPLPYYYLYVLYYLSVLNGSITHQKEISKHKKLSYEIAKSLGKNTNNLKDILVEGIGMNRLSEVSAINTTIESIQNKDILPTKFKGHFERVESKKGYILISEPFQIARQNAKFNLGGVNTLSEVQLTHNLEFYCGFSFEQLSAIDYFVKDITSGESIYDLKTVQEKPIQKFDVKIEKQSTNNAKNNTLVGNTVTFLPETIYNDRLHNISYLNGKTNNGVKAGISSKDLLKYGKKIVDSFGGVDELLKLLKKEKTKFEAKIIKEGKNGELSLSLFQTGKTLQNLLIQDKNIIFVEKSKETVNN